MCMGGCGGTTTQITQPIPKQNNNTNDKLVLGNKDKYGKANISLKIRTNK